MFLNAHAASAEEEQHQGTDESDMKETTVIHLKGKKGAGRDKAEAGKCRASEVEHS